MRGVELMEAQLKELGFQPYRVEGNHQFVAVKITPEHGRFKGKVIEVSFDAKTFPDAPPHGPCFKPHLMPLKQGGQHPDGGIYSRPGLVPGSDWQNWSRPYLGWNANLTMKDYMAFVNQLME